MPRSPETHAKLPGSAARRRPRCPWSAGWPSWSRPPRCATTPAPPTSRSRAAMQAGRGRAAPRILHAPDAGDGHRGGGSGFPVTALRRFLPESRFRAHSERSGAGRLALRQESKVIRRCEVACQPLACFLEDESLRFPWWRVGVLRKPPALRPATTNSFQKLPRTAVLRARSHAVPENGLPCHVRTTRQGDHFTPSRIYPSFSLDPRWKRASFCRCRAGSASDRASAAWCAPTVPVQGAAL